ncbi:glycosyltransferase [uncultured Thiodictyon sp.]|jgi:glycosyltransferase involved in cell wall biosynthesis|uniref:glycosyltransferase n=1 Tax=uncultured Thiodictyon sp. TaxID=1846217 RepID=UPI0025D7E2C0|nr:glycosyltransferase [uncultured Thiodictyon sp.]
MTNHPAPNPATIPMPPAPGPLAVFASFSGTGGVERMLINLIRGFVDLGQAVDLVLVRAESPHLGRLPEAVTRIELTTNHTLLAAPALARYLRARRPAALLAAKDRAGRTAVLARALAGTGTPLALRLGTHLSTAMAGRAAVSRWLRYLPIRLLYPRLDRIIAVSTGVAQDTARIARLPAASIAVIRNPVITPELAVQAARPCPHPWLNAPGPPVICAAGRLQRQKDFPTLIRAFARVRAGRDCRLLILGEGNARPALAALIAELGLGEQVALVGFQSNPYRYLARAALFVLSSAWEGSPNVLTEALALGVPVVATDCPSGPAEVLDGGRFGPLVPVGAVDAMAAAMAATLDRPLPAAVLRSAVSEYEQGRSARHYLEMMGLIP